MRTWRTVSAVLAAAGSIVLAGVAVPQAASARTAAPYCGITWGSLPEHGTSPAGPGPGPTTVTGVRTGRHACYDRLVVDLAGRGSTYWARYVDTVRMDGSGRPVPLAGGARLQIVGPGAVDAEGRPTYVPADRRRLADVAGYRTFRQVAWAGSFEGQSTVGLGVRARLPFRVFVLDGPGSGSRLVVDVAHRW